MSRRLVLGTAGHIDHGKTALVRALTGVDTDRLEEEKRRGITIDLGFAELSDGERSMGVVDVPGHEAFVRTMVAGATGVDVVLLVIAADEGVMPQTREHLEIVRLLAVDRLVVALTKADLVDDPDWLELVEEDVRALLARTPWSEAPIVPTSVHDAASVEALRARLLGMVDAPSEGGRHEDDLARLPVDRAFTVKGTGTVVTGTLASGSLHVGERIRILPDGPDARIRGLQVHGRDVDTARAGERTAVALAGVDRAALHRGQALLAGGGWQATERITLRARVLDDTGWEIAHNQRVRVHLGTAEVMARVVLLDADLLASGAEGWLQLRLERPLVARTGDRVVLRSYSPMTTVGGGVVVEPSPPRRRRLTPAAAAPLAALLTAGATERVEGALAMAGWAGVPVDRLPVVAGVTPGNALGGLAHLEESGARVVDGVAVAGPLVREGADRLLAALDAHHATDPLRPGLELEALRRAIPASAPSGLADALAADLVASGAMRVERGVAARPDFRPTLTRDQELARDALADLYREAGLAPPAVGELPRELAGRADLWPLLRLLEDGGALTALEDGLYAWREAVDAAAEEVARTLGGRDGLGPSDFRSAMPVTRKHLLPLLALLDRRGVTVRRDGGREVPPPP